MVMQSNIIARFLSLSNLPPPPTPKSGVQGAKPLAGDMGNVPQNKSGEGAQEAKPPCRWEGPRLFLLFPPPCPAAKPGFRVPLVGGLQGRTARPQFHPPRHPSGELRPPAPHFFHGVEGTEPHPGDYGGSPAFFHPQPGWHQGYITTRVPGFSGEE